MSAFENSLIDYEVTEDGVIYDDDDVEGEEGEESDPLASDSDGNPEREAHEEIFGASIDDLIAESRGGGRRRKRRRSGVANAAKRRPSDVPPHLMPVMGAATLAYMMRRFDEAEEGLARIISEAPKAVAPYRTLGLIHEERGNRRKALETFMFAAEMDRQDRDLWKRNAALWDEMGDPDKAIYCLTKALRGMHGQDADALRARAELYSRTRKFRKSADSYIKLSKLVPQDTSVARLIVEAYASVNESHRAVEPLEAMLLHIEQHPPRRDDSEAKSTHDALLAEMVQLLIELWFGQRRFYDASSLLTRLQMRSSSGGRPMTFLQRLMLAICQHRLGSETLASPTFLEFMSSPTMIAKHKQLLWHVAEACRDSGDYAKGIRAYSLLAGHEEYASSPELYLHRSFCYKEMGSPAATKADLERVLSIQPGHVEASLRISEFLPPQPPSQSTSKALEKSTLSVPRARRSGREGSAASRSRASVSMRGPQASSSRIPDSGMPSASASTHASPIAVVPTVSNPALPTSAQLAARREEHLLDASQHLLACANGAFESGCMDDYLLIVYPLLTAVLDLGVLSVPLSGTAVRSSRSNRKSSHAAIEERSKGWGAGEDGEDDEDDEEEELDDDEDNADVEPAARYIEANKEHLQGFFDSERGTTYGVSSNLTVPSLGVNDTGKSCSNAHRLLNSLGASLMRSLVEGPFVLVAERVLLALAARGQIADAHAITKLFFSLGHVRIESDTGLKSRLRMLDVATSFAVRDIPRAFDHVRTLVTDFPARTDLYRVYAMADQCLLATSTHPNRRSSRFLSRQMKILPRSAALAVVAGHCSARGGSNASTYTLGQYLRAFASQPGSSVVCLCVATQLLHVAQSRRVGNRNQFVLHALGFLDEYRRKRRALTSDSEKHIISLEIDYNVGRAMHQLGLHHMAADMYSMVLDNEDTHLDTVPAWADLRRDAAYNLAQIYKATGSHDFAAAIVSEHLVF